MENQISTSTNISNSTQQGWDQQKAHREQNLMLGILGGTIAALIGAGLWAGITAATHYQIGYMAIGVGFLVGFTVRLLGKGVEPTFGYIGAVLALLGCFIGNFLTTCIFISIQSDPPISLFALLSELDGTVALEIIQLSFQPMDLLFYGIAIYAGYQYSFSKSAVLNK